MHMSPLWHHVLFLYRYLRLELQFLALLDSNRQLELHGIVQSPRRLPAGRPTYEFLRTIFSRINTKFYKKRLPVHHFFFKISNFGIFMMFLVFFITRGYKFQKTMASERAYQDLRTSLGGGSIYKDFE